MRTWNTTKLGFMVVALMVISACSASQASIELDADGVWVSVDGSVNYYIKPGDTLKEISAKVGVPLSSLLDLNQLERDTLIFPGQSLLIWQVSQQSAASYLPNTPSKYGEGRDFIEIERIKVNITRGETKPLISLNIHGQFLDSCISIIEHADAITQSQGEHTFYLAINPVRLEDVPCEGNSKKLFTIVNLLYDYLHAGEYQLEVNGYVTSFTLDEAAGTYPPAVNAVANAAWEDIFDKYQARAEIIRIEKATWSDNCLELPAEGEDCEDVETLGFYLVAIFEKRTWVYHSNTEVTELRGYETEDQSLHALARSLPVTVTLDFLAGITVRSGPDSFNYPVVGRLENGLVVTAIGVGPNDSWLLIIMPGPDGDSLAWLDMMFTDYSYDVELPIIEPPPPASN